jgi:hypothetical protein
MFNSLVFMVRSARPSPGVTNRPGTRATELGLQPTRAWQDRNHAGNTNAEPSNSKGHAPGSAVFRTPQCLPTTPAHPADRASRTAPDTPAPQLTLSALHARGQKKNARPEKTSFDVQTNGRCLHDAMLSMAPSGIRRIIWRRRLRLPPRRRPCLLRRHTPRGGYTASSD